MTPDTFVGMIEISTKAPAFNFTETEKTKDNFSVWFYRRETETHSLEKFLESITPENMGWDKPTRQLYYKDKSGSLYKVDFQPIDSVT